MSERPLRGGWTTLIALLTLIAFIAGGGFGIVEGHWIGWYSFIVLAVVLVAILALRVTRRTGSR